MTDLVDELVSAAAQGTVADLTRHPSVPAAVIRDLLLGHLLPTSECDPRGPTLVGAKVFEPLDLADASVRFPIRLIRCRLERLLFRNGSAPTVRLTGSRILDITVDGLQIDHDLDLSSIVCQGRTSAIGCVVGGFFSLRGSALGGTDPLAVICDGTVIGGSAFWDASAERPMTVSGEFRARSVTVKGDQVSFSGATVRNLSGIAINLDGSEICGSLYMTDRHGHAFVCVGTIRGLGLRTNGPVELRSVDISTMGDHAVSLDRAAIGGSLLIWGSPGSPSSINGEVRGLHATIGGDVIIAGAVIRRRDQPALSFDGAIVTGSMRFGTSDQHLDIQGQLRAINSSVGRELQASNLSVDFSGRALMLESVRVGALLHLTPSVRRGSVTLAGARCGVLVDRINAWPDGSDLSGFVYGAPIGNRSLNWSVGSRVAWLSRMALSPQAYRQLADVYRRHGLVDEAEEVEIALRRALTMRRGRSRRAIEKFYDWSVRYGYRPSRALIGMIALILLVATLLAVPSGRNVMAATTAYGPTFAPNRLPTGVDPQAPFGHAAPDECGSGAVRCFNAALYAIDTVIPLVDLGQRDTWHPDRHRGAGRWYELFLAASTVAGWALTSVFVLALSRAIRQRD